MKNPIKVKNPDAVMLTERRQTAEQIHNALETLIDSAEESNFPMLSCLLKVAKLESETLLASFDEQVECAVEC